MEDLECMVLFVMAVDAGEARPEGLLQAEEAEAEQTELDSPVRCVLASA